VDGFRFDLASTLARELYEVNKLGAFFDIIQQDPVLSQVKLIAEPWDLGAGGYQVGNFPSLWSEWNGKYRDCVRHFWKGDGGHIAEFATRICGSSDLYAWSGKRPHASINFVTCHDGFTLNDLVSYDRKHNEANGENNQDGSNDNISWNCGAEGPTEDPAILSLRARKVRSFLATLMFSQGVPMLLAGDEVGHTQNGNNNGYCQDNEMTWQHWDWNEQQTELLEFVQRIIEIRNEQPVFYRRRFFHGQAIEGEGAPDIAWLNIDGTEMTEEAWNSGFGRCVGLVLFGDSIDVDDYGAEISGDTMLLLFNADHEQTIPFTLPEPEENRPWQRLLDTTHAEAHATKHSPGDQYPLGPASLALFMLKRNGDKTGATE
jgi:glycogen operon protein